MRHPLTVRLLGRRAHAGKVHRAYLLPRHHLLMCEAILLCPGAQRMQSCGISFGSPRLIATARWLKSPSGAERRDHEGKDRSHCRSARRRRGGGHGVRWRQAGSAEGGADRGGHDSTAALGARNPAAAFGARGRTEAVHRRPRRARQAPGRADRRDVQSHVLFRRPGRAARHRVRVRPAHGGAAQQALQDRHRQQDPRDLLPAAARNAAFGARRRQGGPGCGAGSADARAGRACRLQRSHPDERQPDPGHRSRRARRSHPSRTCPARRSSPANWAVTTRTCSRSTRSSRPRESRR